MTKLPPELEQKAREIALNIAPHWLPSTPLENIRSAIEQAMLAALAAAPPREPTLTMSIAGEMADVTAEGPLVSARQARHIWRAMYDAAMKEQP